MFDFFKNKKESVDIDEISESLGEDLNLKKDPNIINVKLKIISLDIFHEAYNIFILLEYNKKDKKVIDPSTNNSKLSVIKDSGEIVSEKKINNFEELSSLFANRINFQDKMSIYAVKDITQVISIKAILDALNDQKLELNMLNYDGDRNIKVPTLQQGIAYIKYSIDYSDFCDDNFISDEEIINANIIGSIPFNMISHYDLNVKYFFTYEKGKDKEMDEFVDKLVEDENLEIDENIPNKYFVVATFFTDNDGITFVDTY